MPIRRMMSIIALTASAAFRPSIAQVRADPGIVIDGRVAVRVYVTLSDDETSYAPIGGVNLRFFRTTADTTVVVRTDGAGTATAMLLPGEYRLVSTSPVDWKGSRYSWSQLIQVRPGLPTVELTAVTAAKTEISADAAAAAAAAESAIGSGTDTEIVRKDPSMATMLSFFLTGTGHIYSGERAKGAALLAVTAVGVGIAAKQLSCATAADCKSTTGGMALGAAGTVAFFGSWLYGIMDAGDAARRFNSAHGIVAIDIEPMVLPARGGRTRLGLSLSMRR